MPELPEVETVKNAILPLIKNKTIVSCQIFYNRLIQSDINSFKNDILNKEIINIRRRGKFLLFDLSSSFTLIVHLRMEGKFNYYEKYQDNIRKSSTSCLFKLNDNSYLAFDDTRKFGLFYLTKTEDVDNLKMIKKLGIEGPLIKEKDYPELLKKFKKNKPIKTLLSDQENIAGLGNIYCDEVLYLSKVHPLRKGKDLSDEELITIFKNVPIILKKSIELGGSTIHSFKSNGIDGRFQQELLCYGKEGEICPRCGTYFHKIFLNGRGTTFCPNCQINPSLQVLTGLTGRVGSGKSSCLNYLKSKGYLCISSDEIIHKLYRENNEMTSKLKRLYRFNFDIDNKVDRKRIRDLFIQNPEIKVKAEAILYFFFEKELLLLIQNNSDKLDKIVIEVPLLFYAHLDFFFKKVIFIELSHEKQIENLEKRGDDVNSSISLNKSFYINEKFPNLIKIENDSTLDELYKKLDQVI